MREKAAPAILIGKSGSVHVLIETSHIVVSGWLQAQITVRCGGLSAHYSGQFLHGELHKFGNAIEDLHNNLRCTAALNPLEPYLVLMLTGDGHGAIHVVGEARQKPKLKNVLVFEIELEQGDLPLVANTLILADHAGSQRVLKQKERPGLRWDALLGMRLRASW